MTPDSQAAAGDGQLGIEQPGGPTLHPLAETSRFRQGVYRLLAGLLLYPAPGRLDTALEAAREVDAQSRGLPDPSPYCGWTLLLAALDAAAAKDPEEIQNEYVRLFVAGPEGVPCPPYESVYGDRQEYAVGYVMAQLDQEYASAGLGLSPSLSEMPDHVAVEMEFMSFLCRQAADTSGRAADGETAHLMAWQASFLGRHLARWLPEWAGRVAESDTEGTYSVVAVTARAFVEIDRQMLGRFLDGHRSVEPGLQPAPEQPAQAVDGHKPNSVTRPSTEVGVALNAAATHEE